MPAPHPQPQPQPQPSPPASAPRAAPAGPAPAAPQAAQHPGAPGGGKLQRAEFSGDHVLESILQGVGSLRAGATGPAVRAVQQFLVSQGAVIGVDGAFGPGTIQAVKAWQKGHGLAADGLIGKGTLEAMDKTTGVLPHDFSQLWNAHPHNYQDDPVQNTASADVLTNQGWSPDAYGNTCAIRMSVALNTLGGLFAITRAKAKAAGIDPARVPFSAKTGWYYILSAKEMWIYLSKWCGTPSVQLPAKGRFANAEAFQKSMETDVAAAVSGRRGIVAFDKIFTYAGSGHVDLFDGKRLSDAARWYPSEALRIWYI